MECISLSLQQPISPLHSDESSFDLHPDREMDQDEALDYADQFPLPDRDIEEDNQILATHLKQIPSCINVADIEQLLQDIPVLYSTMLSIQPGRPPLSGKELSGTCV